MKAVRFYGKEDIRVESVPDPILLNPRDAIVKVTATAICGSDLHIYGGYIPTMEKGDVLGHEFMGEVVEVGRENTRLNVGDRVVVPFTIACGHCFFCKEQLWSLCDNSNPNAWMAEKLYGYSASGLFGYSHMYGGYPGGQGPDACIDAVGLESHGATLDAWYDRAKTSMYLATDRPHALRQAIGACRKGGIVSIPGVYGGWLDKFPLGAAFAKGLTLKMGQTHMHKYMPQLLERIERGEIDPSLIITHRVTLDDAPEMYRTFREKDDACIKVVMKPGH